MKKATLLLTLIIMVLTASALAADEAVARTAVIYSVKGEVLMSKGTDKEYAAKEGWRLAAGYTLTTGKDAEASLKLDGESLAVLDQASKIQVSSLGQKLSISLIAGSMAVNAAPQKDGQTLEVRAGNSALGIRGTLFTITANGTVSMLEGSGSVDGHILPAGYMMIVTTTETVDGTEKTYSIEPLALEQLNALTMQTILDNRDLLLENKSFSEEQLEQIEKLLPQIISEESSIISKEDSAAQNASNTETIIYFNTDSSSPVGSIGGSSSTGYSGSTTIPTYHVEYNGTTYTSIAAALNALTSPGTLNLTGQLTLTAAVAIPSGATLGIDSNAVMIVRDELTNRGVIINSGQMVNDSNTIYNYGSLTSLGSFHNTARGALYNYTGATLTLAGKNIIDGKAHLDALLLGQNGATLDIAATATLSGSGWSNYYGDNGLFFPLSDLPGRSFAWTRNIADKGYDGWLDQNAVINPPAPPVITNEAIYNGTEYATLAEALQQAGGDALTAPTPVVTPSPEVTLLKNVTLTGAGTLTVPQGVVLNIPSGMTLTSSIDFIVDATATMEIFGTLHNQNVLSTWGDSEVYISGSLVNDGTIINKGFFYLLSGSFQITAGATLNINGALTVTGGTITNAGSILVYPNAAIDVYSGTLDIKSSIIGVDQGSGSPAEINFWKANNSATINFSPSTANFYDYDGTLVNNSYIASYLLGTTEIFPLTFAWLAMADTSGTYVWAEQVYQAKYNQKRYHTLREALGAAEQDANWSVGNTIVTLLRNTTVNDGTSLAIGNKVNLYIPSGLSLILLVDCTVSGTANLSISGTLYQQAIMTVYGSISNNGSIVVDNGALNIEASGSVSVNLNSEIHVLNIGSFSVAPSAIFEALAAEGEGGALPILFLEKNALVNIFSSSYFYSVDDTVSPVIYAPVYGSDIMSRLILSSLTFTWDTAGGNSNRGWVTPKGEASLNGAEYTTLVDALEAAAASSSTTSNVELLKNVTLPAGDHPVTVAGNVWLRIPSGKTLTNSGKICVSGNGNVFISGVLTIEDSGMVTVNPFGSVTVDSGGKLTISGNGSIIGEPSGAGGSSPLLMFDSGSSLVIDPYKPIFYVADMLIVSIFNPSEYITDNSPCYFYWMVVIVGFPDPSYGWFLQQSQP